VDESAARYYGADNMRLLLLLSALLASLVGSGAQAVALPRPACAVSAVASVSAERRTARIASIAPLRSSTPQRAARVVAPYWYAPVGSRPLYANRLRV